jgi:hypothetical protein
MRRRGVRRRDYTRPLAIAGLRALLESEPKFVRAGFKVGDSGINGLNAGIGGDYVIERHGAEVRVYFSERGRMDQLFSSGSEDDACLFFLVKIEEALPCDHYEEGLVDPEGQVRCRECGYLKRSHLT